jgi:hypothetical protein
MAEQADDGFLLYVLDAPAVGRRMPFGHEVLIECAEMFAVRRASRVAFAPPTRSQRCRFPGNVSRRTAAGRASKRLSRNLTLYLGEQRAQGVGDLNRQHSRPSACRFQVAPEPRRGWPFRLAR